MDILSSNVFRYNKNNKTMMTDLGKISENVSVFPTSLVIKSARTGKIVTFFQNRAVAEQNEFWDGEMMEYYSPMPGAKNVRVVVTARQG